jgi:hypothetical protein
VYFHGPSAGGAGSGGVIVKVLRAAAGLGASQRAHRAVGMYGPLSAANRPSDWLDLSPGIEPWDLSC